MSLTCVECGKHKAKKLFCGKDNIVQFDNCRDCRMTPLAEKVARREIVQKSSVHRGLGKYTPAPWPELSARSRGL